ncbi:MAG: alkaline phosphatase D family protein [Polyangiaceae bacterium]
MRRRDFLFGTFASVIYVTVGCGSENENPGSSSNGGTPGDGGGVLPDGGRENITPTSPGETSDKHFPQGVASGDPKPDRVILWTRVDPLSLGKGANDNISLKYLVGKDPEFLEVVARGELPAEAAFDHTLRVAPVGLLPSTTYYYRFEVDGKTTRVGRTKTAPTADDPRKINFAFTTCQDYVGRYYHAWQALLEQQLDLDFVLFLGDYVYETVNDTRFQSPTEDRKIKLPNGLDISPDQDGSVTSAVSLADYRTLYKTVRSDAMLREVHRLYPFIMVWDDHEYANDCWQDHSTDFNEKDPKTGTFFTEQTTQRREDASRAWAEFVPADVKWAPSSKYPGDLTIYRALRYGKHVELFVTDQRSYRSDHLIPEGETWLAMGKFSKNTPVGSKFVVRKSGFDPEEASKKPSLLGAAQKAWFLDSVKKSNATWRIWANAVVLHQQAVELGDFDGVPNFLTARVYISTEGWDGYRSERGEILKNLALAGVKNLVAVTGDVHAFYAAELYPDFDNLLPSPVAVEFVTAGISSSPLEETLAGIVATIPVLKNFAADLGNSLDPALMKENGAWMKYADSAANGIGLLSVDGAQVEATFIKVREVQAKTYSGILGKDRFITKLGSNRITKV